MNDKELLELAAKAAGMDGYNFVEESDFTYPHMERRNMGGPEDGFFELQADVWSPLTDDGDALRLSVKLGLEINICNQFGETNVYASNDYADEKHNSDPYAATRRAIVRAAAAIGSKL